MGEIEPLIRSHHHEVSADDLPMSPDWAGYAVLEESGSLAIFTVREAGALIGYATFIKSQMLHHKNVIAAHCDMIYLDPAFRAGPRAFNLIRHCEQELKLCGVRKLMWGVKIRRDWSPVLKRLGYEAEEIVLSKTFKER